MSTVDRAQETRRLAELYAAMSDGELEKIASDGAALTEEAQAALAGELKRRESSISIGEPVPAGEIEFCELVTVRQFRDLPDALMAQSLLESAGIKTFLADDNLIRMDWFISNLLGGLKLKVAPEDADAANELLNEPAPRADFESRNESE